jgi:enoyl-CoA hydratase/carnithine racemase
VPVKFHIEDRVAVVTLARPDRLNAISSDLLDGFAKGLDEADACAADVILLEAEGRSFCAGDDLQELAAQQSSRDEVVAFVGRLQDISRRLMFGPKPVICAVQGYVVGGGVAWPLNADFSIVSDDAVLFCPEARWGMFASGGVTTLLADCCGQARANEIIWGGIRVKANELVTSGIIGRMVAPTDLAAASRALANQIADLPADSRKRMKVLRVMSQRDRIEAAMKIETQFCIEAALDPALRARVRKQLK